MSEKSTSPFTMMGEADAQACEGDSCLVPPPVEQSSEQGSDAIDIEPSPAEAAAASTRAITTALDEGAVV